MTLAYTGVAIYTPMESQVMAYSLNLVDDGLGLASGEKGAQRLRAMEKRNGPSYPSGGSSMVDSRRNKLIHNTSTITII